MQYLLVVYRSRNVTIQAYNFLMSRGANCALVSTPQKVGIGCGLSVKCDYSCYQNFGAKLSSVETFAGFYLVKVTLRGTTIVRL